MSSETQELSKKRFVVSIYEVREIVFAEEFSSRYSKTVTLSDGTARTVELTPLASDGPHTRIEFNDTGHRSFTHLIPVKTGGQTNGSLMVRVFEMDGINAAGAEWRKRLPVSPVLPPNTSLTSIPEIVPPGFEHGIEILNDNTTPMQFVTTALNTHAGLSMEDCAYTIERIHRRGGALVPTPSLEDAQRIAAQISADAAQSGYPLICRAVSAAP